MNVLARPLCTAAAMAAAAFGLTRAASAHPHVWVTYSATVVYDKGSVIGLDHLWTFDEMYTAMAIQGLDKNNDGVYDREELAELAKVNMDGLKEFDYFTFAKLGAQDLKFSGPQEPWLEHKDGILSLHFRMALAQPVLAEAEGLNFSVYDPTFFIAFEPSKTEPAKVAGAPDGCKASLSEPKGDKAAEDAKVLSQMMAQQLTDFTGGVGTFKVVAVACTKS